jgi:ABC-2 type transport system ATP-binding protein
MIELIDLTKRFKDMPAVDGINLRVERGTIFGFLGPNGAGKTTTIKMMAGVLKPTSGTILIGGDDLAVNPVRVKRRVGFIPDRPYLYEKLTAMDFLDFIAGLYRLEKGAALAGRILKILTLFDLVHWRNELIESFSHGMKQRLVMCAALLHEPSVLIIDEPMVGLDPKGARLVKDILSEQAAAGTTVFMSTHSLDVAQEVCREVAIIQAGRIVAQGNAESLKRQSGIEGSLEQIFLTLTEDKSLAHERPLSAYGAPVSGR